MALDFPEREVRPPSPPPGRSFLPHTFITIRHPGYPDRPNNVICRLLAADGYGTKSDGADWNGYGIHYRTAVEICSIIACNYYGCFSTSRVAELPDEDDVMDTLLTASEYYYYPYGWAGFTAEDGPVYPICPSFAEWQFPHKEIPYAWLEVFGSKTDLDGFEASQSSQAPCAVGRGCVVSGFVDTAEDTCLVPSEEETWFLRNGLSIYNQSTSLPTDQFMSDVLNRIPLRANPRYLLKQGAFAIVPKYGKPCVHFLTATQNYASLFHNRMVRQMDTPTEFIYARFALAALKLGQAFAATPGVHVRVWCSEDNTWKDKIQGPRGPGSAQLGRSLTRASPNMGRPIGRYIIASDIISQ